MPQTPAIVARMAGVAARIARARGFSSSSSSERSSIAQQLAKLDEMDKADAIKVLHKVDAEMKMEIDKHVDLAKEALRGEEPGLHWLCDMCRVPKGEFREKLAWRCFLGVVFLSAGALGRFWEKKIRDATSGDTVNATNAEVV